MRRASDVQARPVDRRPERRDLDPTDDHLSDLFASAVGWARRDPGLLRRHRLPLPSRRRCLRALRGRVPRSPEFPPRLALFDNLSTILGLERIVTEGARFRPAEHGEAGELAVVQPVTASGHPGDVEPVDLVAWNPERPARWWLLSGLGTFLGPWPLGAAELRLAATPLGWLRDPEAVCLLSYAPRVLEGLLGFSWVSVEDAATADALRDELAARFLPVVEARA